jgi:hypothetical protein
VAAAEVESAELEAPTPATPNGAAPEEPARAWSTDSVLAQPRAVAYSRVGTSCSRGSCSLSRVLTRAESATRSGRVVIAVAEVDAGAAGVTTTALTLLSSSSP